MAHEHQYKIKRSVTIGAAAAEDDEKFLSACFVDNGDLARLKDTKSPERIVLGRTGAGKSAILRRLAADEEHVIWINPEDLALTHLCNNGVLKFFEEAGVKLDLFYKLLWRHIFAVELIKAKYGVVSEKSARRNFLEKLMDIIQGDDKKKWAIDYLREWSGSIWKDTEYRVKEVTSSLERGLSASVRVPGIGGKGASKLTEEQKTEVVTKGQDVVNNIQIKRLSEIMGILADDIFTDSRQKYYVLIDRLDEDWVEDRLRYKLIRALIETVREFKKVQNSKIIVALRQDLFDRVFKHTRDAGFQQEKYESLCLQLTWTKALLVEVLDRRVNELVRHRYSNRTLSHKELLPKSFQKIDVTDYLILRTLYRPRDVILFFNCCLKHGEGKAKLDTKAFGRAEGEYSKGRFRSLGDEWFSDYPNLLDYAKLFLKENTMSFEFADFASKPLDEISLELIGHGADSVMVLAEELMSGHITNQQFAKKLIYVFYQVGLVGVKLEGYEGVAWSFLGHADTELSDLTDRARIHICPAFYRVLGVNPKPSSMRLGD